MPQPEDGSAERGANGLPITAASASAIAAGAAPGLLALWQQQDARPDALHAPDLLAMA